MFYLAREVEKFGHVLAEKKVNFIMINEFKYGQAWKIWPSPLSLSLYNPFKYVKTFSVYKLKRKKKIFPS